MANTVLDKPAHCWYSAGASEARGTLIYRMEDGSEKHVTAAYPTKEAGEDNYLWPDKQYLGLGTYHSKGDPRT